MVLFICHFGIGERGKREASGLTSSDGLRVVLKMIFALVKQVVIHVLKHMLLVKYHIKTFFLKLMVVKQVKKKKDGIKTEQNKSDIEEG